MSKTITKDALRTELELKGSPLGTLLEHLPRAVMILDKQGIVRYASPATETVLGRTSATIIGKDANDFLVEEDRAKARSAFNFVLDKVDIPIKARLTAMRGDGARLPLDALYKNHLNDKLVSGIVVIAGEHDPPRDEPRADDLSFQHQEALNSLLLLSLEELPMKRFLESSLRLLSSQSWLTMEPFSSIYLVVENTRSLSLESHWGSDYHPRPCAEVSLDKCAFGGVTKTGEPLAFSPASSSDEQCPELCPANCLAVPLKSGTAVIGVLVVAFPKDFEHGTREQKFLASFANILAQVVKKFRRSEENTRLAAIARENPNPVIACDENGVFTYDNPAARKLMWQHSVELTQLLPQTHNEIITNCMKSSGTTRKAESSVGERTYSWTYHPVPSISRMHIFGRDITDRRRAEKQIVHDAMHDGLTGLPNRNLLMDRINGAMGMATRHDDFGYALMMLDLDRFKVITESLGPSTGDRVLRKVASRLLDAVGEQDTVGRIGGDEFVILLEDVENEEQVIAMAESAMEQLSRPIDIGDHKVVVTSALGVVMGDKDYERPDDILRDADTAMYRAKSEGRGRIEVFEPTMRSKVVARMQVQSDLREAIENGQLRVHYQPVLSLSTLRIKGFEALVRWEHPTRGMIAPLEFISVAEETGLIIPLGELVLRKVCQQLAEWKETRMPLAWVAVNLSAEQFEKRDLVQTVLGIIDEAGAIPQRLQLEITEGTAANNPERAVVMLSEFRDHGIRVALDDFGTGYSSMSYLKRFPIDSLKIDRSFVKDLPESHDDAAIATSVIAMAQSLGLKTVAEGVENERQAMFLKSRGCDEVQGFMYAKPMEANKATKLLKHGFSFSKENSGG